MAQPQSTTLDGLPKRFVLAMRTLFDILDDKKTGYVRFSDIEQWWQDDNVKGLPKGVLDCLQKVTPPNGLLSFERLCAGLKICLLRSQVENQKVQMKPSIELGKLQPKRPPSAPVLDIPECGMKSSWSNTATVYPNNAIAGQRTHSMPQLVAEQNGYSAEQEIPAGYPVGPPRHAGPSSGILYGPPKPPRTALAITSSERNLPNRAEITTALQNWQQGVLLAGQEALKQGGVQGNRGGRSSGDGKPAGYPDMYKKAGPRRREPRRHTLQNGIDYNMLKKIKQIEQEKDVLMQGLNAVERARDWYLKQVAIIQDKMKYLGRVGSHAEPWSEAQAEKLELQKARVVEVNRHLQVLTESWERGGLPLHMNLAVHHPAAPHAAPAPDIVARVKHQNRLLTKEVGQQGERITMLEHDKAALLRELYQARAVLHSRAVPDNNAGFM